MYCNIFLNRAIVAWQYCRTTIELFFETLKRLWRFFSNFNSITNSELVCNRTVLFNCNKVVDTSIRYFHFLYVLKPALPVCFRRSIFSFHFRFSLPAAKSLLLFSSLRFFSSVHVTPLPEAWYMDFMNSSQLKLCTKHNTNFMKFPWPNFLRQNPASLITAIMCKLRTKSLALQATGNFWR